MTPPRDQTGTSRGGARRTNLRSIGTAGEDRALTWFRARGYELRDRNFSTSRGEIDLVLDAPLSPRGGCTVVFVEVKWRVDDRYGAGAEAVTPGKLAAMRHAALVWLSRHPEDHPDELRFDVLDITAEEFTHYEGIDGW